jgi:hypothetical protein
VHVKFGKASWSRRLREHPPGWPWGGEDADAAGRKRWLRDPEPFEDRGALEAYPGATVLDDLTGPDEELAALRVLARYTAVRLLLLAVGGLLHGPRLRTERRVALGHLALLPAHDWERHVLERLCAQAGHAPGPELVNSAIVAAEAAAKRGHGMGAFALYRAAFQIARDHAWWEEGARAAGGIERLAALNEAPWSARLWQRRANVLQRRARKALEPASPETQ